MHLLHIWINTLASVTVTKKILESRSLAQLCMLPSLQIVMHNISFARLVQVCELLSALISRFFSYLLLLLKIKASLTDLFQLHPIKKKQYFRGWLWDAQYNFHSSMQTREQVLLLEIMAKEMNTEIVVSLH